jgi:predicted alpha/beta superfamily hydrolase
MLALNFKRVETLYALDKLFFQAFKLVFFLGVLSILTLSISQQVFAASAFEIPRSEVFELIDPNSHRTYPIFVKLPRSYAHSKDKKYPVIYLTDAMYSFQVVSGVTRFPMNSRKMHEAIIVGISYAKQDVGAASRVRDYTPTKVNSWKMKTGDAAKHVVFLQNTVFPSIERKFRAKNVGRTFIGHSLGGLFGAYILLQHNTLFDHYIIGSPSVWFNDNYILSNMSKPITASKKIYISVGEFEVPKFGEREDMVSGAQVLYKKLSGIMPKADIRFRVIPEATHATSFPTTFIQGLHWLLKNDDV